MLHLILFFLSGLIISIQGHAETGRVQGHSMEPIITNNQVLVISKDLSLLKRESIITFKIFSKRTFVKRVRAIPGDEVVFKNDRLLVNGKILLSGSRKEIIVSDKEFKKIDRSLYKKRLVFQKYLVLSENESNTYDSRAYGAISLKQISGLVILPLSN
jgi:signal peptidase I